VHVIVIVVIPVWTFTLPITFNLLALSRPRGDCGD
jgi:hypothetical protein